MPHPLRPLPVHPPAPWVVAPPRPVPPPRAPRRRVPGPLVALLVGVVAAVLVGLVSAPGRGGPRTADVAGPARAVGTGEAVGVARAGGVARTGAGGLDLDADPGASAPWLETAPLAPAAAAVPAAPVPAAPARPAVAAVWERLARCEAGGDWGVSTGNGYYGGLQFDLATWRDFGGPEFAARPHEASKEEQVAVAVRVRDARGGYGAWPGCAAKLGLPR